LSQRTPTGSISKQHQQAASASSISKQHQQAASASSSPMLLLLLLLQPFAKTSTAGTSTEITIPKASTKQES
jgi:hypothetical protein